MPDNPVMEARKREETGSRAARRLRNSGLVPAVIYGGGIETECLAVDAEALAYTEQRSKLEDTDITEAIVEFNMADSIYQAALASTARILGLSLVDFL